VGQQVPDFNTFQVWMTERIIITANERGGWGWDLGRVWGGLVLEEIDKGGGREEEIFVF